MQHAQALAHKLYRGERMTDIIQTYKLGNTTIHIYRAPMASETELAQMNEDILEANYCIWDSLSEQEQLEVIKESA